MAYTFETDYLDLLFYILQKGEDRNDRTGTGTKAIFGHSLSIDLKEGFPLITTKKMAWKAILSELLWFIEGSGDERRLAEILHGTRDQEKKTIWSPNAEATTGSRYKPRFKGDLGRVYGVQWRDWKGYELRGYEDVLESGGASIFFGAKVVQERVDQLHNLIESLKSDPHGRRHILTAWNPGELDQMMLPPCHMFAQFYLNNRDMLSCQMYQRSVDAFLGLPFNIASYALLTHLIANCIGSKVDTLTMVLGDTHIYKDHIDAVKTQLERDPLNPPQLLISAPIGCSIDDYTMENIHLEGYQSLPAISAKMSA